MTREWLPIAWSIQQWPSLWSMTVNWYEGREVGARQSLICRERSNWEGKSFLSRGRRVAGRKKARAKPGAAATEATAMPVMVPELLPHYRRDIREHQIVLSQTKVIGMGKGDSVEWKESRPIGLGHIPSIQPNGVSVKMNGMLARYPNIGVRRFLATTPNFNMPHDLNV
ncbi:hypothetical protein PISMIDRAFT_25427 [Pisolithus microcarpus 441]|uniref:Uncharacterized protein n=1 Tax=Pisolithus microcarpus 441 TaxID=765257 RepID=A0A0C9XPH0_9AGAM|nr:hypothetical protein PISMIDRAFT_25427 [Pisolithus microcarpus 441]